MPAFSVSSTASESCAGMCRLTSWQRLVRFLARDGRTYYGDAILPKGVSDVIKAKQARIIKGDIFGKYDVTDEVAEIRHLLAPLGPEDVKTVRCLGLNYALHAKEVRQRPLAFTGWLILSADVPPLSPTCQFRNTPSCSTSPSPRSRVRQTRSPCTPSRKTARWTTSASSWR